MNAGDDAALVRRAREGDGRAFEALMDRYERPVFNLALRMVGDREDARDLTQAVFVKAFRGLGGFDESRRFFSWIYRIALNETLNFRSARRTAEPLDDGMDSGIATPEQDYGTRQLETIVQAALQDLGAEHRQVIVMRHFLQLSHREIGEALEVAEKTVKSRLHSARQKLGEALQKRGVTRP